MHAPLSMIQTKERHEIPKVAAKEARRAKTKEKAKERVKAKAKEEKAREKVKPNLLEKVDLMQKQEGELLHQGRRINHLAKIG